VPEYWVLDPLDRLVWIWRFAAGARDPDRVDGSFEWQPRDANEPLLLDTAALFRPL
jgi:hypothetical protein